MIGYENVNNDKRQVGGPFLAQVQTKGDANEEISHQQSRQTSLQTER